MPRYKPTRYDQVALIPVNLSDQILPGTFEHTLHHLIEQELCLDEFDSHYHNDKSGAPAYNPRILLKIVLGNTGVRSRNTRRTGVKSCNHVYLLHITSSLRGRTKPTTCFNTLLTPRICIIEA